MDGPGESLRQERESRGKTIEEMAEATGIRHHLLTALEQEAYDSLPGRGFGKLYIRAYAEVLGFDPRPVIEAYDRAMADRPAEEPAASPGRPPRPVKAMLDRWRQERMAERAEAGPPEDFEDETFDEYDVEVEERHPAPAGGPAGTFQGAVDAEPRPVTMTTATTADMPGDLRRLVQEALEPPRPVEAAAPSRPGRWWVWPSAAVLALVLLPLTAYVLVFRSTSRPAPAVARQDPVAGKAGALSPVPPPVAAAPAIPKPAGTPTPKSPAAPPRAQAPGRDPAASSLRVTESGVGLRLVGTRLEGQGDRFRSGQRVTFATRVMGGGAGESIRHVWLRDGKVEQSIRLGLGGSNWRTYSTKTLGRPGAWSVEARDERGNVLVRADLDVAP